MFNGTLRHCSHIRSLNHVTATLNDGLVESASAFVSSRNYSQDKGGCCKDIAQTQGKKVQQWPKSEPQKPAWRLECFHEPQPPNYDPYKIKVPDVVCPPLPPSNAKWTGVAWTTSPHGGQGDRPYQSSQQQQAYGPFGPHQNYQPQGAQKAVQEEAEETSSGFLGYLRGLFRRKGKKEQGQGLQSEDARELFQTSTTNLGYNFSPMLNMFRNSPVIHPDYFKESNKKLPCKTNEIQEPLSKLGYHGKNKYKFAFHEPWKPLDRLTLLSEAEKEELDQTEQIATTAEAEKN